MLPDMRRLLLMLTFMLGCGSRTGPDLSDDRAGGAAPGSGSGQSGSETPLCSLGEGPVDASVPGDWTGQCPASEPYCVPVPGMAIFGCCPTPQGEPEGCVAPAQ